MSTAVATTGTNQITTQLQDNELIGYLDNLGLTNKLTDGEKNTYLQISKAFGLNPFKREIYVSKYGENLSIITGYEVYIKRAERTGMLDGWSATTEGSVASGDLKAIVTIYRKDRSHPFVWEALYSECVQKTREGKVTKFWEKSAFMTKKVAISQGFRLCFSDELAGMPYTADEMPENVETYDTAHVEVLSSGESVDTKTGEITLPAIPAARYKKLIDLIKADGADITAVLKQARGSFSFTPEQETEFNGIIAEAASKKQAA
jgi:hypothetical protein